MIFQELSNFYCPQAKPRVYIATGEKPPTTKLFLLRIILSLVLIVIYPIMLFVDVKEKIKNERKNLLLFQRSIIRMFHG